MIKNQKKSNSVLSIVLMVFVVITAIALIGTLFKVEKQPSKVDKVEDTEAVVLRTERDTVIYSFDNTGEVGVCSDTWFACYIDKTGVNDPQIVECESVLTEVNKVTVPAGYTHVFFGANDYGEMPQSIEHFYFKTKELPVVSNENMMYFHVLDIWVSPDKVLNID